MSDRTPKNYGAGVNSVPTVDLTLVCIVCGKDTGEKKNIRSTLIDPKDLKPGTEHRVREGLCPDCREQNDRGHTIFVSETRGAILEIEANDKIQEEFRGKIIKIPEEKMDEVLGKNPSSEPPLESK